MSRAAALAGLLLVLATACGGGGETPVARAPLASPGARAGATASPGPSGTTPAVPLPTGGATAPVGGASPGAPRSEEQMPLEVSIEPPCGSAGTAMRAEITTSPAAQLSVMVTYADGKNYGQWGFFRADPRGRFTYPWVVPAQAPPGEGNFLVAGTDARRGGRGIWPFRVAAPGGC